MNSVVIYKFFGLGVFGWWRLYLRRKEFHLLCPSPFSVPQRVVFFTKPDDLQVCVRSVIVWVVCFHFGVSAFLAGEGDKLLSSDRLPSPLPYPVFLQV